MARGRTSRKRRRLRNNAATSTCVVHKKLEFRYIELLRWAKKNGVTCCKMRPAVFHDTGRGMMACRKVQSGDCVVSVPRHMLISTRTVQKSSLWEKVLKKLNSSLTARQMLSIFLIHEKHLGKKSFWYPYFCTLPTTFNTPAYFTERELQCIPSSCRQECEAQMRRLQEQYAELKEPLKELGATVDARLPHAFTFEEFRWAWVVVNTRSVYMAGEGPYEGVMNREQDSYALAPVLDLLNHSDTAQVNAGFNFKTESYEIHSISRYNRGSQIFINYGPHDNKKLFMEYGFVLAKNVHSVFQFNPENVYTLLKPRASISSRKLDIIRKSNVENDLSCSRENGLSWSLLTLLRLLTLDEEDLDSWQKVLTGSQIPAVKERQVQEWAVCLIQHALKCCGCITFNNSNVAEAKEHTANTLLALQLRSEEVSILKQTLVQFHDMANQ